MEKYRLIHDDQHDLLLPDQLARQVKSRIKRIKKRHNEAELGKLLEVSAYFNGNVIEFIKRINVGEDIDIKA